MVIQLNKEYLNNFLFKSEFVGLLNFLSIMIILMLCLTGF